MKSDIVLRRQHVCRAMEAHGENFWGSGKRYREENYSPGLLSEEEIDVVGLSPEEESRKASGRSPPRDVSSRPVNPSPKSSPVEHSAHILDRSYQPTSVGLIPKDANYGAEPLKVHLKRFEPTIVSGPVLDRRMSEEKNYQPVPMLNDTRPVREPAQHYRQVWPYPPAPVVGVPVAMPSEYSGDVLQHPNYTESRHYGKVSVIFNASSERVTSLSRTVTTGHPYASATHAPNGYPYMPENYARCNNHGKVSNYNSEETGVRISPPTVDNQQYPEAPPRDKRMYYEQEPLRSRKRAKYDDAPNFRELPEGNSENSNLIPASEAGNVKYPEDSTVGSKDRYSSHDHLVTSDFIQVPPENTVETVHAEADGHRKEYVSEQQITSPSQLNYSSDPQYENYEQYSDDIVSQHYQEDTRSLTEDSSRDLSQEGNYAKCSNHGRVSETINASSEEVATGSEIQTCSSSANDSRRLRRDRLNTESQTNQKVSETQSQNSVPKTKSTAPQGVDQKKSEEKTRIPTCARCKNHNETAILKGHKTNCPRRYCKCDKCLLVHKRQIVMAKQVALNRKQQNPELLSPSSLASSDMVYETSETVTLTQQQKDDENDEDVTDYDEDPPSSPLKEESPKPEGAAAQPKQRHPKCARCGSIKGADRVRLQEAFHKIISHFPHPHAHFINAAYVALLKDNEYDYKTVIQKLLEGDSDARQINLTPRIQPTIPSSPPSSFISSSPAATQSFLSAPFHPSLSCYSPYNYSLPYHAGGFSLSSSAATHPGLETTGPAVYSSYHPYFPTPPYSSSSSAVMPLPTEGAAPYTPPHRIADGHTSGDSRGSAELKDESDKEGGNGRTETSTPGSLVVSPVNAIVAAHRRSRSNRPYQIYSLPFADRRETAANA